jgi:hypothetical protein
MKYQCNTIEAHDNQNLYLSNNSCQSDRNLLLINRLTHTQLQKIATILNKKQTIIIKKIQSEHTSEELHD